MNEIKNTLDPITQNLILPEESSPDQQILPPAAECGADTHTQISLHIYLPHERCTKGLGEKSKIKIKTCALGFWWEIEF